MHVTKRVSLVVLLFALNVGLVWGQAPAGIYCTHQTKPLR